MVLRHALARKSSDLCVTLFVHFISSPVISLNTFVHRLLCAPGQSFKEHQLRSSCFFVTDRRPTLRSGLESQALRNNLTGIVGVIRCGCTRRIIRQLRAQVIVIGTQCGPVLDIVAVVFVVRGVKPPTKISSQV